MDETTVPKGKAKRTCEVCGVVFEKYYSQVVLGQGKFCSRECRSLKPKKPRKRKPKKVREEVDMPHSMHVVYHRLCMGEGRISVLESEGWNTKQYYDAKLAGQPCRIGRYWPFESFISNYMQLGFNGLKSELGINNTTAKKWLEQLGVGIRGPGDSITTRERREHVKLTHRGPVGTCVDLIAELSSYPKTRPWSPVAHIISFFRTRDFLTLYRRGDTYEAIAERFDVSYSTVYVALASHQSRRQGPPRKSDTRRARKALMRSRTKEPWRTCVLEASNGRCVHCGSRYHVQVDHIVKFVDIFDKYGLGDCTPRQFAARTREGGKAWKDLTDVRNGRALCARCHRKTVTYGAGTGRRQLSLLAVDE